MTTQGGPPTPASGSALSEHDLDVIEARARSHGDETVVPMLVDVVRRLLAVVANAEALLTHWQSMCAERTEERDRALEQLDRLRARYDRMAASIPYDD